MSMRKGSPRSKKWAFRASLPGKVLRFAGSPAGKVILAVFLITTVTGLATFGHFYWEYSKLIDAKLSRGPFNRTSRILAAPSPIYVGDEISPDEVLSRLRTQPVLVVAGRSGSGKSSLVRAGVAPAVEEGALGERPGWRVLTLVPGRRPLTALCTALLSLDDLTMLELRALRLPPREAELVHRQKRADEEDVCQREVQLRQPLVEHPPEHLRKPIRDSREDAEQTAPGEDEVEVGDDVIGVVDMQVDRDDRQSSGPVARRPGGSE